MITLAPILIEEAESHLKGIQAAITALLQAPVDEHSRVAVKRLTELFWLIDNGIRDHERGNVIPFMRPVTTAVRQFDPALWPQGAA